MAGVASYEAEAPFSAFSVQSLSIVWIGLDCPVEDCGQCLLVWECENYPYNSRSIEYIVAA